MKSEQAAREASKAMETLAIGMMRVLVTRRLPDDAEREAMMGEVASISRASRLRLSAS